MNRSFSFEKTSFNCHFYGASESITVLLNIVMISSNCLTLKIFGLGLGASETEEKVKYRQMARVYHPDMWKRTTGLTSE